MFKILIDTCVWLDLAKDYQGQGVLGVLGTLVREKQVSITAPCEPPFASLPDEVVM
jgi:hypothetical protein